MLTSALTFLAMSTYTNPVWAKNFPDPFILTYKGEFFAYATHSGPGGFQVLKSKDLVAWEAQPGVPPPDWANGQLWAPEVHEWKGKWYMFYSARDRESRKRDLAVSVADHPAGPYKFAAKLIEGKSENEGTDENGAIDPTFHVEGGKPYLFYIRESKPRSIKLVELSPDLSRTAGERRVVLNVDRPIERGILDAPTLVKRDRNYWLFYSSGWFQSLKKDACYQVWAAKSKSLFGPYEKPEKPLLTSRPEETYSPGHQCVFRLANGDWWMAYHGWNSEGEPRYAQNKTGRTLRIDRIEWTPNGPMCNGPTLTTQPAPKVHGSD